jgi:hypothetical protein
MRGPHASKEGRNADLPLYALVLLTMVYAFNINGIGGTVGVLIGGLIIHRLGLRDARRQCLTLAVIVTAEVSGS